MTEQEMRALKHGERVRRIDGLCGTVIGFDERAEVYGGAIAILWDGNQSPISKLLHHSQNIERLPDAPPTFVLSPFEIALAKALKEAHEDACSFKCWAEHTTDCIARAALLDDARLASINRE